MFSYNLFKNNERCFLALDLIINATTLPIFNFYNSFTKDENLLFRTHARNGRVRNSDTFHSICWQNFGIDVFKN